ncbi:MAG: hypothetical protein K0B10_03635 [Vicingaceae bacterium]|nr:hypothetical protein [Vicingaceae bacterium]
MKNKWLHLNLMILGASLAKRILPDDIFDDLNNYEFNCGINKSLFVACSYKLN